MDDAEHMRRMFEEALLPRVGDRVRLVGRAAEAMARRSVPLSPNGKVRARWGGELYKFYEPNKRSPYQYDVWHDDGVAHTWNERDIELVSREE